MAGGKKKKKPAANPARGFATTSVASKPRADTEPTLDTTEPSETPTQPEEQLAVVNTAQDKPAGNALSAEEFEKQLEDNELQVLVDKHAQKAKRDAVRQKTRLDTDRRVLRSQAEILSTRKWLPPELMEEILELIKAEGGRGGNQASDASAKQASEEELTIRLWTLQQALVGAGFLEDQVALAIRHVLDISDKITSGGNKDVIWGMEESLEWLARECPREQLPGYDGRNFPKSQSGRCPRSILHRAKY